MNTIIIYVIMATVVALVCGLAANIPSPERPLPADDTNPFDADVVNVERQPENAPSKLPKEITEALAEVRRDYELAHTRSLQSPEGADEFSLRKTRRLINSAPRWIEHPLSFQFDDTLSEPQRSANGADTSRSGAST